MNLHVIMIHLMRRLTPNALPITNLCPPICFCFTTSINLCLCMNVCASSQAGSIDDEPLGFFINEKVNLNSFLVAS